MAPVGPARRERAGLQEQDIGDYDQGLLALRMLG